MRIRHKRQPLHRNMQLTMSRIIEDWQMDDKVLLFGKLIILEAALHWLWVSMVIIGGETFYPYIVPELVMPLFIGCTGFILVMIVMNLRIKKVRRHERLFTLHQIMMMVIYSLYICTLMMLLGQDSLFTGISLMGGIIIAMLLVERQIVHWIFGIQCCAVVTLMVAPYWVGELPSLRQDVLGDLDMTSGSDSIRQSHMFWRLSYVFLGLPKVIAIVYTVRKLLDAIDYRKARIRYQAEYDELTEIRNRRSLMNYARSSLGSRRNHGDKSIVIIDLDHFKQINDVYGHVAGDEVLYKVAQLLKMFMPPMCEIGRYGGEEFLVVMPNTSQKEAIEVAENLRKTLEKMPIDIGDGRKILMTASFGVATLALGCIDAIYKAQKGVRDHPELKLQFDIELNDIIKMAVYRADRALYTAKNKGRNQVVASAVIDKEELKELQTLKMVIK